jgi:hypothetical protein
VCKWANDDGGTICEQEPVGVEQVSPDYLTIIANNGTITVKNSLRAVEIYDIMGRMIQTSKLSGDFTSKTLHTGLYLVRVDGFTEKVLVK